MKLIKKVIGVDIAKDSFAVRFGTLDQDLNQFISKAFRFSNNLKGFNQLLKTIGKVKYFDSEETSSKEIPVCFVMEATGVYYENLAYFLAKNNFSLSVILAKKVKNFSKTLDNKSKTDDIDAANQTQYGLEKKLKPWIAPAENMKELKELTREYNSIKESLVRIKNRLHAKDHSYEANKETVKRINQHKKFLEKQLKQIIEQMKKLVQSDKDLNDRLNNVLTLKGVGLITILTAVAETNNFALIENKNQLTSYAGFDIVHDQSGNHIGKTRISKKGNAIIRKAMYMPALSAVRFNNNLKQFYIRLCKTKVNKKIALIAVARKLLILIYCLWKKNEKFIQDYPGTKAA